MPATADDCSSRVSGALPRLHGALARRCSDIQNLTVGNEEIRNLAWADLAGDSITLKVAESIAVDAIEATGQQSCDANWKEAVHKVARNATVSVAKLCNFTRIVCSIADEVGHHTSEISETLAIMFAGVSIDQIDGRRHGLPVLAHAAATAVGRGRRSQADAPRSRAVGSVPGPPEGLFPGAGALFTWQFHGVSVPRRGDPRGEAAKAQHAGRGLPSAARLGALIGWASHWPHIEKVSRPTGLQSLTFGQDFNLSIEKVSLPTRLQSITVCQDFNQSFEKVSLPTSQQSITFGMSFNQNTEKVSPPTGLQSFTFGTNCSQSMEKVSLPTGLQSLTVC